MVFLRLNKGGDMTIFLLMSGAMFGFIAGYVFGLCEMDSLYHRVKEQLGGYAPSHIPTKRPSPPSKE